ncbi:MAG: restriction endonuclease subunit S [Candidatus Staskawiczbacteria bacterium]|nr:restriction endonuclease subunit S [Candidatus Staskawiczbacteria bacterium]
MKTITKEALSSFKLSIPSLLEQRKIAEFMNSIDNLIESKQQQITQAEQWKKGLMQGLFV